MPKINLTSQRRFPEGRERWSAYVHLDVPRAWRWVNGPPYAAWVVARLQSAPHGRIPAADLVREYEALRRGLSPLRKPHGTDDGWTWLLGAMRTGVLPLHITWRQE